MEKKRNIWCIEKVMRTNMINGLQNQGCLMQKRWLKIIEQGVQVKTYKEKR